ncbi:MAG: type IV pili twitching motility protein PilT, partial [Pseudomonadota bacterium]
MSSISQGMNQIDEYLREMLAKEGSDLHFMAGDPPRLRVHGELTTMRPDPLANDAAEAALYQIMSGVDQQHFRQVNSTDFAYSIEGLARFRVNVFRH